MQVRSAADRDEQLSTLQASVVDLWAEVGTASSRLAELSAEVRELLAAAAPGDDALARARVLLRALEEQMAEMQRVEARTVWYAARLAGYQDGRCREQA